MNVTISHYQKLSFLFDYPDNDFTRHIKEIQALIECQYPNLHTRLQAFTEYMCSVSLWEQQELYLRSFDVQAVTTLDVGYVMFGDDYKRGEQ